MKVGADGHEELNTEQARAGETPHVTRHVLVASLLLVVIIFAAGLVIWS